MNKNQFILRAAMPLVLLGIVLASTAYIPILRFSVGMDDSITMSFSTTLIFLIAGYMAGLAGLIAWAKAVDANKITHKNSPALGTRKPHVLGLSLLIPIPFLSCVLLLAAWIKDRAKSTSLDAHFRHTINFHLTLHLYFLLCFFLAPLGIGFIAIFIFLILFLLATLWHLLKNNSASYPANINIIPPEQAE